MKLSQNRIIDEAIAIMQEEGLDAVSLRRIAARLDAKAPSLARHVGDKQMLLALMSNRLFREAFDAVPQDGDWQHWMIDFGKALWRKQQETRDIAKLIAYAPPNSALQAQTLTVLSERLVAMGLPIEKGMIMQSAVQVLITGWTGFLIRSKGHALETLIPVEEAVTASLIAMVTGFAGQVADE